VAAEEALIVDPTIISYTDTFVGIVSMDVSSGDAKIIVIFTDSSMFLSQKVFEALFEIAATELKSSLDSNVIEITGFATINERGWFGKWTPYRGYTYYPLA